MDAVNAFNQELFSLMDMKPPISRAKMIQITKSAIKAIKLYKHVVQIVEKFIKKCKPEYKVPGLYVVDSIVRQSRHQFGPDKDVFGPRFIKNLTATFQCLYLCPTEDKSKIVRVLNLWQKNGVFKIEIIQPLLDMAAIVTEPVPVVENSANNEEPVEYLTSSNPWQTDGQGKSVIAETQHPIEFQDERENLNVTWKSDTSNADGDQDCVAENEVKSSPPQPWNQTMNAGSSWQEQLWRSSGTPPPPAELPPETSEIIRDVEPPAPQLPNPEAFAAVAQLFESTQGQQLQQFLQTFQQPPKPLSPPVLDKNVMAQVEAITAQLKGTVPQEPEKKTSFEKLLDRFDYDDEPDTIDDSKQDVSSPSSPTSQPSFVFPGDGMQLPVYSQHPAQLPNMDLFQARLMGIPQDSLSHQVPLPPNGQMPGFGMIPPPQFTPMVQPVAAPPPPPPPPPPVVMDPAPQITQTFQAPFASQIEPQMQNPQQPEMGMEVEQPSIPEVKEVAPETKKSHSRSASRSPKRRRSRSGSRSRRSRHRRSRSRSRDRRRSSPKSRSQERREREKEREKERERRQKGLQSIKPETLSVYSTTLWIGQLDKKTVQQDVESLLEEFGAIKSIHMIGPRGCAYIVMAQRLDAFRALQKLSKGPSKVNQKPIKIAWALNKGIKSEYKKFWKVDLGVTNIPWEKVKKEDLESICEGGMLDTETLCQEWKDILKKPEKTEIPQNGGVENAPSKEVLPMPPALPVPISVAIRPPMMGFSHMHGMPHPGMMHPLSLPHLPGLPPMPGLPPPPVLPPRPGLIMHPTGPPLRAGPPPQTGLQIQPVPLQQTGLHPQASAPHTGLTPLHQTGPPLQPGQLPHQPGQSPFHPPHQPGQPPQQPGQPPQQPGQPPQQPGQPPQQPGQPPQPPSLQPGQPPQQPGQPPQQPGQPPQQPGQPPQQPGQPAQQPGLSPQQPGQPPHQSGQPPHQGMQPPHQPPHQVGQPPHQGGQPPHQPLHHGGQLPHQPLHHGGQPPHHMGGPPHQMGGPLHHMGGPPHHMGGPLHQGSGHLYHSGPPPVMVPPQMPMYPTLLGPPPGFGIPPPPPPPPFMRHGFNPIQMPPGFFPPGPHGSLPPPVSLPPTSGVNIQTTTTAGKFDDTKKETTHVSPSPVVAGPRETKEESGDGGNKFGPDSSSRPSNNPTPVNAPSLLGTPNRPGPGMHTPSTGLLGARPGLIPLQRPPGVPSPNSQRFPAMNPRHIPPNMMNRGPPPGQARFVMPPPQGMRAPFQPHGHFSPGGSAGLEGGPEGCSEEPEDIDEDMDGMQNRNDRHMFPPGRDQERFGRGFGNQTENDENLCNDNQGNPDDEEFGRHEREWNARNPQQERNRDFQERLGRMGGYRGMDEESMEWDSNEGSEWEPHQGPRDCEPRQGPRDWEPHQGPRDWEQRQGPRDWEQRQGPRPWESRPDPRGWEPRQDLRERDSHQESRERDPHSREREPLHQDPREREPPRQDFREREPFHQDLRERDQPRHNSKEREPIRMEPRMREPQRPDLGAREQPYQDSRDRPPPHLDSRERPPPHLDSRERPTHHLDSRERPPPHLDSRERPPHHLDSRDRPPPHLDSRERPPPHLDSRERPPPHLDSRERPPPLLDSRDRPPPLLDSRDRPPPHLDSRDRPPPHLDSRDRPPPPHLDSRDRPPPHLESRERPPLLDSRERPPLLDRPPPLLNFRVRQPLHLDSRDRQPSNHDSRERPPPHQEVREPVSLHKDLREKEPPNQNLGEKVLPPQDLTEKSEEKAGENKVKEPSEIKVKEPSEIKDKETVVKTPKSPSVDVKDTNTVSELKKLEPEPTAQKPSEDLPPKSTAAAKKPDTDVPSVVEAPL